MKIDYIFFPIIPNYNFGPVKRREGGVLVNIARCLDLFVRLRLATQHGGARGRFVDWESWKVAGCGGIFLVGVGFFEGCDPGVCGLLTSWEKPLRSTQPTKTHARHGNKKHGCEEGSIEKPH